MEDLDCDMEKIITLCKNRGFIYANSEIYGGLSNTWDYGPLGVELKNNIKKAWWKKFIQENHMNVGIDSSILMNNKVWKSSGHTENFSDPLIDCLGCKRRFRIDQMTENLINFENSNFSIEYFEKLIADGHIRCPNCGNKKFTKIRNFNLMFQTRQGTVEEDKNIIFLRPETAQGIFVNFKNILRTTRKKMPFGIGQIGKSFRNEITLGNFIFRTREFEQMELEFFCNPDEDEKWFDYWVNFSFDWLLELGIKTENLRIRDYLPNELSHYSKATSDIEFLFPFGFKELWGISNRGDFDLKNHSVYSGEKLEYSDEKEKYTPYCIEPSLGVERVLLALLIDAYEKEKGSLGFNSRIVLHLHPFLAPFKAAVLPLSKKLSSTAFEIYNTLSKSFMCDYDEAGSIGKRYRRHDEIATPYCITYDFESEISKTVTVRDRDTMKQERVPISEVTEYIENKIAF